jgi:hypothetical protein
MAVYARSHFIPKNKRSTKATFYLYKMSKIISDSSQDFYQKFFLFLDSRYLEKEMKKAA